MSRPKAEPRCESHVYGASCTCVACPLKLTIVPTGRIGTIAEVTVTVTAFECPYMPDDGRAAEIVAVSAPPMIFTPVIVSMPPPTDQLCTSPEAWAAAFGPPR